MTTGCLLCATGKWSCCLLRWRIPQGEQDWRLKLGFGQFRLEMPAGHVWVVKGIRLGYAGHLTWTGSNDRVNDTSYLEVNVQFLKGESQIQMASRNPVHDFCWTD